MTPPVPAGGDMGTAGMTAAGKHGDYAGLSRHKRRGEEPCQPCKDAGTVYMRDRRASRPGLREAGRWWGGTRDTALARLAYEYQKRYLELLKEERDRDPQKASRRWWNSTRTIALERLAREHQKRFLELVKEERDRNPRPETAA